MPIGEEITRSELDFLTVYFEVPAHKRAEFVSLAEHAHPHNRADVVEHIVKMHPEFGYGPLVAPEDVARVRTITKLVAASERPEVLDEGPNLVLHLHIGGGSWRRVHVDPPALIEELRLYRDTLRRLTEFVRGERLD